MYHQHHLESNSAISKYGQQSAASAPQQLHHQPISQQAPGQQSSIGHQVGPNEQLNQTSFNQSAMMQQQQQQQKMSQQQPRQEVPLATAHHLSPHHVHHPHFTGYDINCKPAVPFYSIPFHSIPIHHCAPTEISSELFQPTRRFTLLTMHSRNLPKTNRSFSLSLSNPNCSHLGRPNKRMRHLPNCLLVAFSDGHLSALSVLLHQGCARVRTSGHLPSWSPAQGGRQGSGHLLHYSLH